MIQFIKEVVNNPKTGAIAASSEELAELITKTANLSNANAVVELGPGTGVFTEKILQKISNNTIFFSLEINPVFVESTKKRCPSAVIYQDSAKNIKKYLGKHEVDNCDCIISGLPWAMFDDAEQDELLQEIVNSLSDDGEFLTFAYIHGMVFPTAISFRNKLKKKFKEVKTTEVVWKNLPPAFVYHCKK